MLTKIPDFEVPEEDFLECKPTLELTRLYYKYKAAQMNNREFIDFDAIHEYNTRELIKLLQRFGITQISVSSRWSSLLDDLWGYISEGCTFGGMCVVDYTYSGKPAIILNIPTKLLC